MMINDRNFKGEADYIEFIILREKRTHKGDVVAALSSCLIVEIIKAGK
jgi:hypothetical protein